MILGENFCISTTRTMMKYLRLLPISIATTLAVFGVDTAQAQSSTITVSGVQYTFCGSENDNCTFSGTRRQPC
jgi:hypothetical protein